MKSKLFKSTWTYFKTGLSVMIQKERLHTNFVKPRGEFVVWRNIDDRQQKLASFKKLKDAKRFVSELMDN